MGSEWISTTIGDLARVTRGASPRPIASTQWFDSTSNIRWIRIADVNRSDGRTLRTTTQALSRDGVARSRYLDPGTLIMSIAATVGIPIITGVPACIHDGFVALEDIKVNQRFLLYLLKGSESRLRDAGQSGSQTNINSDIVRGLEVRIPSDSGEQARLAEALWDLDDLIASLDQLVAKKRAIKQGMMQELFSATHPEDEVVPLGSVVGFLSGGTPNRDRVEYWTGDVPWISATTLKDIEVSESDQHVTSKAVVAGSKMAPLGSTLVLVRGSALHSEIRASLVVAPVCFNQDVKALVPSGHIVPKFLTYSVHGNADRLLRLVTSAGNTAGVLDSKVLKEFAFWIPAREIQNRLIAVLDDVTHEIEALERRLETTRSVKQGMMQELLTGRTRLVPTEATA